MLQVKEIDVFYEGLQALSKVSMEIQQGEVVAILGPNGAGKTTLLNTISGLLNPKGGEIYFNRERIDNLASHQVVDIGISVVPEEGWLFPRMSVLENILMGTYSERAKEQAEEMKQKVFSLFPRLKERENQKAGSLSGGERQMLAIGRGLMANPEILMIDEASQGIAPNLVVDIFQTLASIHEKEGITMLLTEQNVEQVLKTTERGYVLENGEIVLEEESDKLKNHPHIKEKYLGI